MGAEIEVADLLTKGMLKTARNSQEDDRHGRRVIQMVLRNQYISADAPGWDGLALGQ